MLTLLLVLLLFIFFWLFLFAFSNDFSVPIKNIQDFRNVLVVFPHADDEVLHCGGLLTKFSKENKQTTLVVLTKGEKGTPTATINNDLKQIRVKEAEAVAKILKIKKLVQKDFGDGAVVSRQKEIEQFLEKTIDYLNPDLLITYDLVGLYGHEDHIVVSEIVTRIAKEKGILLWYVSFPKRLLSMAKLPEHMAKDPNYASKRLTPNMKVFVGLNIIRKIQAVYKYKSQYQSFRSTVPFGIPLWFLYSLLGCMNTFMRWSNF